MDKIGASLITIILIPLLLFTGCSSAEIPASTYNTNFQPYTTEGSMNNNDYASVTAPLTSVLHALKIYGRCPSTDNGLAVDWGGSGIAFELDCEGSIYVSYIKSSTVTIYFTVYIDGVRVDKRYAVSGISGQMEVATNLARGVHKIEIYKQNQIEPGLLCEFTALTYNGEILQKPQDEPLKIEFVGDSITAGMCNLGINGINGCEPEYCDTTQTYAFLTAKALNANFSIVAQGGAAFTPNTGTGVQMYQIYKYTDFVRFPNKPWQFNDDNHIIVINLGTNDYMKSPAEIMQYAFELGSLIKQLNPSAKIIFCGGMMTTNAIGSIRHTVSDLGGESSGIYFVELPKNNQGSGAHPNVEGNKQASTILIDFIKNTVLSK